MKKNVKRKTQNSKYHKPYQFTYHQKYQNQPVEQNSSMLSWITKHFTGYIPTKSTAIRALRHMRSSDRKNLFSDNIMLMRTAEGYWYEYLIYEELIKCAEQTCTIKKIVKKGKDAKTEKITNPRGFNGLYSAEKGDIRVRGNGQDLAEVDLLLFDNKGQVVFCEIVTTPADLKDLEEEIIYKKKLFGYLFGQEHVGFILFSSVDIGNTQTVKRLKSDPDNAYICTANCETLKRRIRELRVMNLPTEKFESSKLISTEQLSTVPFDYKKLHDEALAQFYFAEVHKLTANQYFDNPSVSPLVKKIICGGLHPPAVKELIEHHGGLRIKEQELTADDVLTGYSKVVIAVDFPEIEPVVYIKPRKKHEYLKMVPSSLGGFKYERITPSRIGFYRWLETMKPIIGAERLGDILNYCADELTAFPKIGQPKRLPDSPAHPEKTVHKNRAEK